MSAFYSEEAHASTNYYVKLELDRFQNSLKRKHLEIDFPRLLVFS